MLKKIIQKKLSDEIIEQLKVLIIKNIYKPGDELPSEREMAKQLNVSRPPLREALNALQVMGLIEIRPRRKVLVRSLTEKSFGNPLKLLLNEDINKIFELLEIRRLMEIWATKKAAKKATNDQIERLQNLINKDWENFENGVDDAKTDADFHYNIYISTDNLIFSHLMSSCYNLLWDHVTISRRKLFRKEENRKIILNQHQNILNSIKERNEAKAVREAIKHIDFAENELKKIIHEQI